MLARMTCGRSHVEPMKSTIHRARAAIFLILTLQSACDNVNWGGADVTIVPPPPKAAGPPPTGVEPGVERLPEGPILFYVVPGANGGEMTPVGEISGDSLKPLRAQSDPTAYAERFIAEQMRQGSEFVLFSRGVRVGTLVVSSASATTGNGCAVEPRATGALELSSSAEGITRFLALSKLTAPAVPRRNDITLAPTRTMQVLAPILAEKMMRARRAGLPGNWQRAMWQLMPFPVPTGQDAAFATTFLVGDTLGPGLDDLGHSTFYVGIPSQLTYDTVYVDFHNYAVTGKYAPQVIDYLDWDRDDYPELLLRVYGISDSWLEAVGRGQNGQWGRIYSSRCERTPASTPSAAADSMAPDTTG